MQIQQLVGKTLTEVYNKGDEILFTCSDGDKFKMHHHQDCCEYVRVEDIDGDLEDLIGDVILDASERTSIRDTDLQMHENADDESCTWTFYHIRTVKTTVVIRWLGSSNGYYSESVDFEKI